MIPFSMPALIECPASFFHDCTSVSLEELSTICALLKRAPSTVTLASTACQKPGELPARFQKRADSGRDWTCRWSKAAGVIRQNKGDFPPDLEDSASCVNIETTPDRDPLADLLNSGGNLKNLATVDIAQTRVMLITVPIFQISAHHVDLCGGSSLCSVTVNLNRTNARHRELLRIRIHLA